MLSPLLFAALLGAGLFAQTAPPFEEMPKIDVHAHFFNDMPEFAAMLDRIDMRVVLVCVFKNRPALLQQFETHAETLVKKYPRQMHFASTFDVSAVDANDFAKTTAHWLDDTFAEGAVMTKIWKEVGMSLRTSDGKFLMPDSTSLDSVYAHLARRNKPLMAHFGDPIEAWRPLTSKNVHFKYFTENPDWYMYGRPDHPQHEDIMASVDRMLEKHGDLVVIGAHLGSLEHDLEALEQRLDRFPNYHVDVAARAPDLRRYPPEKVRFFFTKYQDRILYGLDQGVYTPEGLSAQERVDYTRHIEDWYRRDYEFYAGPELALPVEVLEKFFHANAERVLPALKSSKGAEHTKP